MKMSMLQIIKGGKTEKKFGDNLGALLLLAVVPAPRPPQKSGNGANRIQNLEERPKMCSDLQFSPGLAANPRSSVYNRRIINIVQ